MNSMQFFFVSGSPKSGTTWLQMMLDAHPEVTCSGEGAFVEHLALPLAKLKDDYNSHQKLVAERVYGHRSYYPPLDVEEILPPIRALVSTLMLKRVGPDSKAVGDKTPRHNLFLNSLHRLFPDARYINIVRHPYDVAVSKLHHGLRAGHADALEAGSKTGEKFVRITAEEWARGQDRVAEFQARRPGRLIEVRYEDLLSDPIGEATRLFEHLGVSADREAVAAAVDAASFEKLSGGRAPGTEDKTSFFRKGVAGDWKNQLDPELTKLIDTYCARLMDTYQYERAG